MSDDEITVSDNADEHRYEVFVDGARAGFAAYRASERRTIFTHAEVDEAFEGKGVGSVLAREALDDTRRHGKRVVPLCPFIAAFIDKHPEYADLVDE